MHSDAIQSLHGKKTVSWNFKFNLRSTQQSSALKEILPKYIHRSVNKCITFLLREAAFLVRSGLQVTTVATAESAAGTQHSRGRPQSRRSSSLEQQDRPNDKHMQIASNQACQGLELAEFALLQDRRGFLLLNPWGQGLRNGNSWHTEGLDLSARSASQDMKLTCNFQPFPASTGKLHEGLFLVITSFDLLDLKLLSRLKPCQLTLFACLA